MYINSWVWDYSRSGAPCIHQASTFVGDDLGLADKLGRLTAKHLNEKYPRDGVCVILSEKEGDRHSQPIEIYADCL